MNIADNPEREQEIAENLDSFFNDGETHQKRSSGLSIGASPETIAARTSAACDRLLAELDNLDLEATATIKTRFAVGGEDAFLSDDDVQVLRETPRYLGPYDRAFTRVRELEALLEAADDHNAPRLRAELDKADDAWGVQKERALDDTHRTLQRIDRHRAEEGREGYNAARRMKRDLPNADTCTMSLEEQAQHQRDMNAKRVWQCTKRKAGWTEAQIEAELPAWWAKRRAKNAPKSACV